MLKLETDLRSPSGQRCDSCRSAPCAVYCRADAAALCTACDADVHSANPLARRHRRFPMGAASPPPSSAAGAFLVRPGLSSPWPLHEGKNCDDGDQEEEQGNEDEEATSWLLLDPLKGGEALALGDAEVAEYLDLSDHKESSKECSSSHGKGSEGSHEFTVPGEQHQSFQMEMVYEESKHGYGYGPTLCHSLSMSLVENSTVPDCSTAPDICSPYLGTSKSTIDLFPTPAAPMGPQLVALDREARVHRYREKRKTRRFEKTIRYASRKAYAETRPRIKGRFAKRSDVELEVDQYFSPTALADSSYGVVPTF